MRVSLVIVSSLVIAGLAFTAAVAKADPMEYRFEAVEKQVAVSQSSSIAVRLVHIQDRKPVAGAILFQPKMEMPMAGAAPMPTKVALGTPDGKGIYPLVADLSMAGSWILTVSAKIQGESGAITGTVPFTAIQGGHSHNH